MEVKKDSIIASFNNKLKSLGTVPTLNRKEKTFQEEITLIKQRCQEETRKLENMYRDELIKIKKRDQEKITKIENMCKEDSRNIEEMGLNEIMKIIKVKNTSQEIEKIWKIEKMDQDRIIKIKNVAQEKIRKIEKKGQEEICMFEKANQDEIQNWERYQKEIIMIEKGFRKEKINDLQLRVDLLDQEVVQSRDSSNIMMEKLRQLEESIYELKLDKDEKINKMNFKLECFKSEKKIEEEIVERMLSHLKYLRKDQFQMKQNMLELVETCQQFEFSLHQSEERNENLCNHLKSLKKHVGFQTYLNPHEYKNTCTSQGKKFLKECQNQHEVEMITIPNEEADLPEEDVIIYSNKATTSICSNQSKLRPTTKEFKPQSYNQPTLFNEPFLIFRPQPPIVYPVFNPYEQL